MTQTSPNRIDPDQTTLGQLIRDHADLHPDAPALLKRDASVMTYAKLADQIRDLRVALNGLGIGRTNRVALVCHEVADAVGAFLGIVDTASVAPLNPKLSPFEFRAALMRIPFDAVIVHEDLPEVAALIRSEGYPVITLSTVPNGVTGEVALSGQVIGPCNAPGSVQPEDEGTVQMTTGTTGQPKGAISTQAVMAGRALVQAAAKGEAAHAVGILFSPPYVSALFNRAAGALVAGGALVLPNGFDPDRVLQDMVDFKVGWVAGGPTFLRELVRLAHADPETAKHIALHIVISSTTKLPLPLHKQIEETFGVPCLEQYASTETGLITISPLPPARRIPGKVGVSLHYALEVHDDDGHALPPNTLGQIAVRGANLFSEYYNDPETTAASIRNGWFYTGDMGQLDEDGQLELVGRKKELINRGGEKISPFEIEEAIRAHPAVQDSISFAMPHRTLGQVAAAAVVPKPGQDVTEDDIKAHLRTRLAAFKLPTPLFFAKDIPLGKTTKPDRIGAPEYYGLLSEAADPDPSAQLIPAPESGLERTIATLWAECLGVDAVSPTANFIEAGGDSLQAMRLLGAIEEVTGIWLATDVIFEQGATVAGMAAMIRQKRDVSVTPLPPKPAPRWTVQRIAKGVQRRLRAAVKKLRPANDPKGVRPLPDGVAFEEIVQRLNQMTRDWPGTPLSDRLPVYGFNLTGSRPPLVWCFNDTREPVALAAGLDSDQPLIALRSLNFVLGNRSLRQDYIDDLADLYLSCLKDAGQTDLAGFGGNCGAGPIAERMGRVWNDQSDHPANLILLEAEPLAPYAGPLHMVFGRESHRFNPFFTRDDPVSEWQKLHAAPSFDIIPGDHGEYFEPDTVGDLARSIDAALRVRGA